MSSTRWCRGGWARKTLFVPVRPSLSNGCRGSWFLPSTDSFTTVPDLFFSCLSILIFSIFSFTLQEYKLNLPTNPASVWTRLSFQMWVRTYLTCWIFQTLQTNSFSHQIQVINHRMRVAPPLSHTLLLPSPCRPPARRAFRKTSSDSWWTASKSAWYGDCHWEDFL